MLKNSPEHFSPLEIDTDKIIVESLRLQLQKMQAGEKRGRNDTKFRVLKAFVQILEAKPFAAAFAELNESDKHAIFTRLENETEHLGGNIPYDLVKKLEQQVYGTVVDGEGENRINFSKKVELEKEVQKEN